jgi:hypothetical protein
MPITASYRSRAAALAPWLVVSIVIAESLAHGGDGPIDAPVGGGASPGHHQ